jgi:hypothetical protein
MTSDRSLERAARSWLEEGPTEAPDRAVDAALSRIQTTSQERDLLPWRLPTMNPIVRLAGVVAAALLAVGLASVAIGPGGIGGPKPTPTPPIAPGTYAVDLPVAEVMSKLDASPLSNAEKQTVIDSVLVIRGKTTLNLRLTVAADQFTLRQGTDGGPLEANPSWHITRNDGGVIAFDRIPAGASTAEYQVIRVGDGPAFTLRATTAAASSVETVVRDVLFNTVAFAPSPAVVPTVPTASAYTGACALMTSKEAETTVPALSGGGAMPAEVEINGDSVCVFSNAGNEILVRLTWVRSGGAAVYAAAAAATGAQAIPALGDAAVFNPSTGELHVRRGDRCLIVLANSRGKEQALAFANVVVPRM